MDTRRPILALEFHGAHERADFGFLTDALAGQRLHRVDPLKDHVIDPVPVPEQARRWVRQMEDPPGLVIAYCACAALGAHIAERTGARLVLVDPDVIAIHDVRVAFEKLCRTLGRTPPAGDAAHDRNWGETFDAARDGLVEQYGGDELAIELVEDLFDQYRSWLRFLAAAAAAPPASPGAEVTVIAGKPLTDLAAVLAHPEQAHVHRIPAVSHTLDTAETRALLVAAAQRCA
jgi:hypothetical protein